MATLKSPHDVARQVGEDLVAKAQDLQTPEELIRLVLDSASTIGLTVGKPITVQDVREIAGYCHSVGAVLEQIADEMATPKRKGAPTKRQRRRRAPRPRA
jgi:hypothetical protein